MKNVKLSLLMAAAISAISVGSVAAMPANNLAGIGKNHFQDVRFVCGESRHCRDTRNASEHRYRHSYGYFARPDSGVSQPGFGAVQPDSEVPAYGIGEFTGG